MASTVVYERIGHVAWITMNRPEALNALNREMQHELKTAWEEVRSNRDVWVAVITGAGSRGFCVGADLRATPAPAQEERLDDPFWLMQGSDSLESGLEVWKPTIAAINGHAIGGGLTIAITCDFRLAAENATFGFSEVKLGMPIVMGAIRAPKVIDMQKALELLLLGERIDSATALQWGLVREVVPQELLRERAQALAERLCSVGPRAVQATKEIAYRGQSLPFTDAYRLGEAIRRVARSGAPDDMKEGAAAWRERRPPQFQNR